MYIHVQIYWYFIGQSWLKCLVISTYIVCSFFSILDVNECKLMEADKKTAIKSNSTYYKECQHNCTEKKIGYECVCSEGYELAPDKHSCTGRSITASTGFDQVTKQVHIPMNLLTFLFITYINLMFEMVRSFKTMNTTIYIRKHQSNCNLRDDYVMSWIWPLSP